MKKKFARLMASLLGVASLALVGCQTGIKWLDNTICEHDEYAFVRITLEPTCTEEGERLMECVDCGKQKTEVMEKIPHDEVVTPGKDPTCTEGGYTEKIVCNVCREVLVVSEARSALGHNFENGVCQTCGGALTANATEVAVTVGEAVAGNWYRIYRPTNSDWSSMNLSNGSSAHFQVNGLKYSNNAYYNNYIFYSGPLCRLDNMEAVICDEYIDVFLRAGAYGIINSSGSVVGGPFKIEASTTISSFSKGKVFRLEFPADHEHVEGTSEKILATCTEDGAEAYTYCLRCNETFSGGGIIAATGHKDENADSLCDACGVILLPVAEVGEFVAGNTYRIYYQDAVSNNINLQLSNDTGSYFSVSKNRPVYLWWSGSSGPIYYLEGLEVVKTDMYMEFNLKAGTYKILKSDGTDTGDTYVIDEETTIVSFCGCYRVVESEA